VAASTASAGLVSKRHSAYTAGRYIVTFADEAVASYTGYQKGFAATQPKNGHKLNANSNAARAWSAHLTAEHTAALAKVGATAYYDYTIASNGVAVHLSARQAEKLAHDSTVIALSKDKRATVDTTLSPHFLGLDAAGGIWSQLGGAAHAGAGIVVGVIDTGIWPENPSFAGGTGIPI